MTSAACSGVSEPGAVAGIVVEVFSKRSPTVLPVQFARKSLPASGGIGPEPSRLSPWHAEQFSLYNASPRLACSAVYTPSLTDFAPCAATVTYAADNRNAPMERIATALFMSLLFHVSM